MRWPATHFGPGPRSRKRWTINPPEIFFRPETLRLRGDLRRGVGRLAEAKADYEAALTFARSIGAEVLAARARASLFAIEGANASAS